MIKSGHEKVCTEISHNENELLTNIGNPLLVKVGNELGHREFSYYYFLLIQYLRVID